MSVVRADKYLSVVKNVTRSEAKKLLRAGCIAVNGKVCKNGDAKIDTQKDEVFFNGVRLIWKEHIYIMMNKPAGVVSASKDPHEKTVTDLVPEELQRTGLFPAGRLDKDTTGFVLITDDGVFAHNILAPGKHVPKTYIVGLTRPVTQQEIRELADGPVLDDEKLLPVLVECESKDEMKYRVILQEGRYHQIKRMFAKQQNPVLSLHRIRMGKLFLDAQLQPGECRELTDEEVELIASRDISCVEDVM